MRVTPMTTVRLQLHLIVWSGVGLTVVYGPDSITRQEFLDHFVEEEEDSPTAVYDGPDSGLCNFGRREDGDLDALEDKGMCSSCSMQ